MSGGYFDSSSLCESSSPLASIITASGKLSDTSGSFTCSFKIPILVSQFLVTYLWEVSWVVLVVQPYGSAKGSLDIGMSPLQLARASALSVLTCVECRGRLCPLPDLSNVYVCLT